MEMELGKLFIGGLSWDTNEDRLREYFQSFGEVMEAVIMKDRATGRARGFGFVVFADTAVAERVLMEKHLIDGRHVEAKKAVPREDQNIMNRNSSSSSLHGSPGLARTKKIFVGGLASTVTESDFKKYFNQFGTITDVVVMYDHNTQRPRGFGFITYDSEEAVDKVLRKIFHELNGKMVEVKRAVPKELSPGPSRSQLSGYNNYSPGRVGSILSSYTQGYNPNAAGGIGVRLDGRFSPVTVGRSNFSPLGPGFGMGLNFEQGLSSSYGGNSNISSNLVYGRRSPSYVGHSNKYDNHIGYNGGDGGNSSVMNPTARALWGNESIMNASSTTNSSSFMVSGTGNSGMSSFGSFGGLWGSSSNSGLSGGAGSAFNNGSPSYNNGDFNVGFGGIGYGRSRGTSVALFSSNTVLDDTYDRPYSDIYENASMYGGSPWQSSPLELEGSGSFGFGLGSAASDVVTKNPSGYDGGYSVSNRQANRGNFSVFQYF